MFWIIFSQKIINLVRLQELKKSLYYSLFSLLLKIIIGYRAIEKDWCLLCLGSQAEASTLWNSGKPAKLEIMWRSLNFLNHLYWVVCKKIAKTYRWGSSLTYLPKTHEKASFVLFSCLLPIPLRRWSIIKTFVYFWSCWNSLDKSDVVVCLWI